MTEALEVPADYSPSSSTSVYADNFPWATEFLARADPSKFPSQTDFQVTPPQLRNGGAFF